MGAYCAVVQSFGVREVGVASCCLEGEFPSAIDGRWARRRMRDGYIRPRVGCRGCAENIVSRDGAG
eukprot:11196257-Lingulodinium_polyedra.AAC.1